MKKKFVCTKCGSKLEWGGFAHDQENCWDCFRNEVLNIRNNPLLSQRERELIDYLLAVVAERYGYEW